MNYHIHGKNLYGHIEHQIGVYEIKDIRTNITQKIDWYWCAGDWFYYKQNGQTYGINTYGEKNMLLEGENYYCGRVVDFAIHRDEFIKYYCGKQIIFSDYQIDVFELRDAKWHKIYEIKDKYKYDVFMHNVVLWGLNKIFSLVDENYHDRLFIGLYEYDRSNKKLYKI
jgi:hypothetical protein